MIINDITKYLHEGNNECNTTQHLIRMKMIFQGWVAKNWMNISDYTSQKMKKINKIIVRSCVKYYSHTWNYRNDILHTPEKYRYYIEEWHKRIKKLIEKCNKPNMRKYMRIYNIDT